MMEVRVLFFASLKDAVGRDELTVEVPASGGLDALLDALAVKLPETAMLALTSENVRLAVNQQLVGGPFQLAADDEVAFLPRVTGG